MYKRIITLFLSCFLVFSFMFTSFATATPSIATFTDTRTVSWSYYSQMQNTVPYAKQTAILTYVDMQGKIKTVSSNISDAGYFNIPKPADFVKAERFSVRLSRRAGALPSSGKYQLTLGMTPNSAFDYNSYSGSDIYFYKENNNAIGEEFFSDAPTISWSNSGTFVTQCTVDLGVVTSISIGAKLTNNIKPPMSGWLKVEFKKLPADSPIEVEGPGTSAGDKQQDFQNNVGSGVEDIAENTGQLVEEQEKTNNLLLDVIQTISSQLKSFWDQLAGEFTNLYAKMNSQHDENKTQRDEIKDEMIENDDKNTNKIIDKLEQTGNFIVNGIIEGLKRLFIPSDEYLQIYFDDLFAWFLDRLGFLSFPIELFLEFVDLFLSSAGSDFVVVLPPIEIMGESLMLENSFNVTEFLNVNFPFVLNAIHFVVSVYIVISFVQLCDKKWKEVMLN